MDLKEIQAFHAIRGTKKPAEVKAFSDKLIADHDAIITYPDLLEVLKKDESGEHVTEKADRKALYAALERETAKYPAGVVYQDPLFGKPFLALRAKMEAFRGLFRDRNGEIIFSEADRKTRIENLKARIADVLGPDADFTSATYGPKVETLKAEIQKETDYLEGRIKTDGSIWDFINGKSAEKVEG
jgi:hypothetical protein